jgi:hypothetical protein
MEIRLTRTPLKNKLQSQRGSDGQCRASDARIPALCIGQMIIITVPRQLSLQTA